MTDDYSFSIFYNCPFDNEYQPTFEAVLFTIYRCGFTLRCAKNLMIQGKLESTIL